MKKIAIIGAGQSGVQLSLGLLKEGYHVTLVSDRSAESIYSGKIMSSQCMFSNALQIERDMQLNLWEKECPTVDGITLTIGGESNKIDLQWTSRLDKYAQAVDQRLKIHGWLNLFKKIGGNLLLQKADIRLLESLVKSYDLVIVAIGKDQISKLFERDNEKSVYTTPQRSLAASYVKNMLFEDEYNPVRFNIAPGIGEYITYSGLTTNGPCSMMVFEGIPDGPMDCWKDIKTPEQHLQKSKAILEQWFPWEAERCKNIQLTDDNAIIAGSFTPEVRKPIGRLPSGAVVLGMADAIVLNDPLTGQGANNACKCADIYLENILSNGDNKFDDKWMQETFNKYWDYAQWVTGWTNAMLQPPHPHVQKILGAAAEIPEVAKTFVNAFDNPPDFFPWIAVPEEAEKFIEQKMSEITA